jgi:integrase
MARKRGRRSADEKMPPGARRTSSGRITITMRDRDGVRRSHSKIKTDEPETYLTPEEAAEGYERVKAFLASDIDYVQTVAGFHRIWSDVDDPEWGAEGTRCRNRNAPGIISLGKKLKPFVDEFGTMAVAAVTDQHLTAWERRAKVAPTLWPVILTFFNDAAKAGMRAKGDNPVGERAANAKARMDKKRTARRKEEGYASKAEVDAMLTHLKMPRYPRSFYGWTLTGVRTGMRCCEIDGMEYEYLDGDRYYIQWQLHDVSNELAVPKHGSRRWITLTDDVLAEIERQRQTTGAQADGRYIWTNTLGNPWRESARCDWWDERVAGTSARELVGGRTIYEATRHHWASRVVNEGIMPLELAAELYGHKDKGATLRKFYVGEPERDALLDAMREAQRRMAS